MRRSGYVFRQLVLLAAAAGGPLLLLLAYNLGSHAVGMREQALSVVRSHAVYVARDVEDLLSSVDRYLKFLSTHPGAGLGRDGECAPLLQGVTERRAHFADVLVLDARGRIVCSAAGLLGDRRDVSAEPWAADVLRTGAPVTSAPLTQLIPGRYLVAAAHPVPQAGEPPGAAVVLLDLDTLQLSWRRYALPPGARLSVVSDEGTVVVSSPDLAEWVGRNVGDVVAAALRDNPTGVGSATGIDGIRRAFARERVTRSTWSAFAGFPESVVLAERDAELRRNIVVATTAVLLTCVLVVLLARRLSQPLRLLADKATAVSQGDTSQRVPPGLPGEYGQLTTAFNTMLDNLEQSERALRLSRGRYAEVFANIRMLSVMTDRSGVVIEANAHLLAATGWTREEILGRPARETLMSDDGDALGRVMLALAGRDQRDAVTEGLLLTRDGGSIRVRWHHSLLRDQHDHVAGLASLGEDVTEQRKAHVRERRQLDFYDALSRTNNAILRIDNADDLWNEMCRTCVEHGHASIAYVSVLQEGRPRAVAWAGPAQAFVGGDEELSSARSLKEMGGVTATALHSGQRCVVADVEVELRDVPWLARLRDAGTRSLAAFPFRRGGVIAGALTLHMTVRDFFDEKVVALLDEMTADLSFALDHIDRVQALRAAQQRLTERDEQLSGLVETAMDAIITIDAGQRIRLFNRAAAAMFGLSAQEAMGSRLDRFVPERLRAVHATHVERFAETGSTARRMGMMGTLVGVRADGKEFPIEASISKWGEGQRALMTVVIRDATQLRRAEEERVARATAESASRAKSDFLSRMSHELRTPLNAIIGFSQLLRADGAQALDAGQQEQIGHIERAGWHLLALVSDVLDVSRIEAGRLRVEPRSVDARELLNEALQLSSGVALQKRVTLRNLGQPGPPALVVHADPIRLRQVLLNVLSNAIKYNRDGGRVDAAVVGEDGQVCFRIQDTGVGMTPQQMQHLYEPFNRLGREHGQVEGSGLGLALTRQLLALMQGDIAIRSVAQQGTVVEITLPASDVAGAAGPAAGRSIMGTLDEPVGTVLYVEDNPVNRLLVEQLLARWPLVRLLQAEDGRSGLEVARRERPEVILLDMRLPDISGHEVLRALRQDPSTHGLHVIVLSGDAMPEDVDAARRAGADDYWTKPLNFASFLNGIARCLAPAPEEA